MVGIYFFIFFINKINSFFFGWLPERGSKNKINSVLKDVIVKPDSYLFLLLLPFTSSSTTLGLLPLSIRNGLLETSVMFLEVPLLVDYLKTNFPLKE